MQNSIRSLLTAALLAPGLFAAELAPPWQIGQVEINSEQVHFDGQDVILSDHVHIIHAMGDIHCQRVEFSKAANQLEPLIHLMGDVKFELKTKEVLLSPFATLNCQTLQAEFFSKESGQCVTFERSLPDRLSLQAQKMHASFEKREGLVTLKEILAQEQVTLCYKDLWTAESDFICYHPDPEGHGGLLELLPDEQIPLQKALCQVKTADLTVEAKRIAFRYPSALLSFESPKGHLLFDREKPHQIEYQADSMEWDGTKDLLLLKGQVAIKQDAFGFLDVEKLVEIQFPKGDYQNPLLLTAYGPSSFTYIDPLSQEPHYLSSKGKIVIDQSLQRVDFFKAEGKPLSAHQISLQDRQGMIFADSGTLSYDLKIHRPQKIVLQGNIYLMNHQEGDAMPQCAIADRLEYRLGDEELLLIADSQKRVLFYDEANHIEMSAPAVHIWRSPLSGKAAVQGEGNVRFTFNPLEVEAWKQIRQRYQQEQSLKINRP
ncbi:MAG: hypothetical protein K0S07_806 [Chlamydiales bacterium]|jgi:lipopolysaccharide export system protein LptA|nr:hypothetical protein [Chlamydiales bacterium]